MTSDRTLKLQDLFIQATEVPGEQREAWLQECCRDEPSLLGDLEALLAHHGPAQDPLERGIAPKLILNPKPPPSVPGYELLREIGTGGQATVYEAIQKSTSQRVALKMLRRGISSTEGERRRFDRELRILSLLKHPHIVSIFDRGLTDEGLSFLVTELIDGVPIDRYSTNGSIGGDEGERFDQIEVFVQAAHAADFAHRAGIVHRDLKPSNILVDQRAEPKILDFGLAKSLLGSDLTASNAREITASGQFLGSLPWASPEQAQGMAADARSDVYSLGVIFYQLITGGYFPYKVSGTVRSVLDEIVTALPIPPSQTNATASTAHRIDSNGVVVIAFDKDLDSIALKALAKCPDDRYQSAAQFARDVEAYVARWKAKIGDGNVDRAPDGTTKQRLLRKDVDSLDRSRGSHASAYCPQCGNREMSAALQTPNTFDCSVCGSRIQLEAVVPMPYDRTTLPLADDNTGAQEASKRTPGSFGRFELLEEVGSGGFGTVFKARDPKLDRVVALKIPHLRRVVDEGNRRRFLQEARHLAQVRHEGIIPVYEVGEAEGIPFLVAEFVEGVTLEQRLGSRRPTIEETVSLCIEMAAALQHAHEAGIVHRDVKPGNIMLDEHNQPHLMDFGLAKQESADISISVTGAILGTPAYMSPEQAAGESENVGVGSDVYSLGVVLYQMLTGELPFRGNSNMLIHQILNEEPRPPRALNDRIPRDLEMICLKAMSKEPSHRYTAADDFAEDLRRFARREPVDARPAGTLQRLGLWCRHPQRIGTASTITIAMALMLAIWELQSLVFIATGVITVEQPFLTAFTIVIGMLFFATLAGLGYLSRHRTRRALWSGAVASVGLLIFSVACLLGYIPIEGLTEKEVRMPVFGFFSIAAAFIVLSHVISLVAYYSNRNIMRWAKLLSPRDS